MLDLMSVQAVRSRCADVTRLVYDGKSEYFYIDDHSLEKCANLVADECLDNYPALDIPVHSRWRHFQIDGTDLWEHNIQRHQLNSLSATEKAKTAIDLVIVSVLLDAGAGSHWHFSEPATGTDLIRSEGLAAASIKLFFEYLGSRSCSGFQLSLDRLSQLSENDFAECFQISDNNPLTGIQGRLEILRNLGIALQTSTNLTRPGDLISVMAMHSPDGKINLAEVLRVVLTEFNSIWPNGLRVGGKIIGDAGIHSLLDGDSELDKVVPFHKLSQWLCYSLIEPLQQADFEVVNLNSLTGLPEYRNGGLLLDAGVIRPKDEELLKTSLDLKSEAVVEWRALTVSLIDSLADRVRTILDLNKDQLPLGNILQGGTWSAGRKIAGQLRSDLSPPLKLKFDGTVF